MPRCQSLIDSDNNFADTALSPGVVDFVRAVVRSELGGHRSVCSEDIEDVSSDAIVALLSRLEDQNLDFKSEAQIRSLDAYIAVIARRACSAWSRRRYPAFYRLRTRLRYLLKKDARFALWQNVHGEWLCGWAVDQGSDEKVSSERNLVEAFRATSRSGEPADLLCSIFELAENPLPFNSLAKLCAELWEITDAPEPMEFVELSENHEEAVEITLDRHGWLKRLWEQLCQLPQRHCAALLLNLRGVDGDCATSLLVFSGVATLDEIANAIGMVPEAFAEIWPRMPISDLEIAEGLNITRQQVINLRKSAKERLRKRMNSVHSPAPG